MTPKVSKSRVISPSHHAFASAHAEASLFAGQKFIGEPRVLYIDIETTPIEGWFWPPLHEPQILKVKQPTKIACVSFRWHHERKTRVISLPRFRGYRAGVINDYLLCKALRKVLDKADIVIAHNGDRFDIKKINGRFFLNNILPAQPAMSIDTLKIARKFLGLDSNKMGDICEALGIGKKLATRGKDTWLGCIDGDQKAWKEMEAYNIHDVDLLVEVFDHLLPWVLSKPNRRRAIIAKSYA